MHPVYMLHARIVSGVPNLWAQKSHRVLAICALLSRRPPHALATLRASLHAAHAAPALRSSATDAYFPGVVAVAVAVAVCRAQDPGRPDQARLGEGRAGDASLSPCVVTLQSIVKSCDAVCSLLSASTKAAERRLHLLPPSRLHVCRATPVCLRSTAQRLICLYAHSSLLVSLARVCTGHERGPRARSAAQDPREHAQPAGLVPRGARARTRRIQHAACVYATILLEVYIL
jgi:hypothetical protein